MPFAAIPALLIGINHWVTWRYEDRNGKRTKIPYCVPTGERASTTDPRTWSAYEAAAAAAPRYNGIGFVFSPEDDLAGVDLDDCRDPETGEISAWAEPIISALDSYTEITPSGRGLHILARGKLPPGGRRKDKIEIYDEGRYFTITGDRLVNAPETVEERGPELAALHAKLFPAPIERNPANGAARSSAAAADWEIADRVRADPKYDTLWRGDFTAYPSHSEADLALAGRIAFFVGPDPAGVDRLFRQSGLCRQKWDDRHGAATYGSLTVGRALLGKAEFFDWRDEKRAGPEPSSPRRAEPELPSSEREPNAGERPKTQGYTAERITEMDIAPVRFAVPGYICEGLNILAGGQKMGKSWMALQIALAVACGGKALGQIDVEAGPVLYIALEDGLRRLQDRIIILLGESPAPPNLWFYTEWPPASAGGLVLLEEWLAEHAGTRMVIIDTLGRFRGERPGSGDIFQQDYNFGARLKRIADDHHIALLLLHHLAKRSADDPFERVSGTTALTASADATLMIQRKRGEDQAEHFVTGRDVEDREMALEWSKETCSWNLLGAAQEVKLSAVRQQILEWLGQSGPSTPAAVARGLGRNRNTVKVLMWKMAMKGDLARADMLYWVPSA